jgi:hypothetical protein
MKFILSNEDTTAILEAAIRDKFTTVLPVGHEMLININSYQSEVTFEKIKTPAEDRVEVPNIQYIPEVPFMAEDNLRIMEAKDA